jgi:hypothetical protein
MFVMNGGGLVNEQDDFRNEIIIFLNGLVKRLKKGAIYPVAKGEK